MLASPGWVFAGFSDPRAGVETSGLPPRCRSAGCGLSVSPAPQALSGAEPAQLGLQDTVLRGLNPTNCSGVLISAMRGPPAREGSPGRLAHPD